MRAVTDGPTAPAPSLRLLVVEFDRQSAAALIELHGEIVDVHACARAAEAIRSFDSDCPDAVIVTVGHKAEQAAALVAALRARPMGALVPVLVLDGGKANGHPIITRDGALEAGADRFFELGTPATHIITAAAELLGIELDVSDLTALAASETAAAIVDALASERTPAQLTGEYVPAAIATAAGAHPLVPAPSLDAALSPPAEDLREDPLSEVQVVSSAARAPNLPTPRFDPSRNPLQAAAPTADAIIRKLRQARHEDYFTVLELRRGSDPRAIELSYERLRQRFDPTHIARPVSDRLHTELAEICDTLDDAIAVLGDAGLREGYLRAILSD